LKATWFVRRLLVTKKARLSPKKSTRGAFEEPRTRSEAWNWQPSTIPIDLILDKPVPSLDPELVERLVRKFGFEQEQLLTGLKYVAATYYLYLNKYQIPRGTFFKDHAARMGTAAEALLRVVRELPPSFRSLLDSSLQEEAGMTLTRGAQGNSACLEQNLVDIVEYCRSFDQPLRRGPWRKDHHVRTAEWLIDLWEELSGEAFEGSYRTARGKARVEFTARGPLFAQLIFQALDHRLTTKQVEGAIRAALNQRRC
jgi:hypothetical protein